ncbi:hypothetical protein [Cohnella hashimotonis]|uniref:THIF-type NAD/FAD binding fold domain-containing protein n=1 Tax=Cohnella hashimotonis TaxID=2826895 RepID=A0ABT6TAY5_9BACL|nr:hypothetical protein [Cohnella hashimotonis]MDI4643480.1 hypothetical protein [Cohnella hashimotonis]
MGNMIEATIAELQTLGFVLSGSVFEGRVPAKGDIDGMYITVGISLQGYPYKQPNIRLLKIKEESELYRVIPKTWRHIDEWLITLDSRDSQFYICCLHNWNAKDAYKGKFIYLRILEWLRSNVMRKWKVDEDLPSWRILPQLSSKTLFIDEKALVELQKHEPKTIYTGTMYHQPYKMHSLKKRKQIVDGSECLLSEISQDDTRHYFSFINAGERLSQIGSQYLTKTNVQTSKLRFIRLPAAYQFKTIYQLLQTIVVNFDWKSLLEKQELTIPLLIMFKGDAGKREVIMILLDRACFDESTGVIANNQVLYMNVDSLPAKSEGISKCIGVLGIGTLGGYVCNLLVKKNAYKLFISDPDELRLHNIDTHVLGSFYLGRSKANGLEALSNIFNQYNNLEVMQDDTEVALKSEILVVVVGDNQSFDRILRDLVNRRYDKPVIWAWMSSKNILQDIVMTTPDTGCLNCYYMSLSDIKLRFKAMEEIDRTIVHTFDFCGNSHTISSIEKTNLLSAQIAALIEYYCKHDKFPYGFINIYWGENEPIPIYETGELARKSECFCGGGQL